jgi:hypothetical protein
MEPIRESIDHGLLSPSGRVSKRARKSAMDRAWAALFPPGFWDKPTATPEVAALETIKRYRRSAAELRELAARGMSCRKFIREAVALETMADSIERGIA